MRIIARIRTDFPEKFGIPRQSGLIEELVGRIIFEPEFAVEEAFRGIEEYSHLWLIWQFSEHLEHAWSPTVRPPRLGGNRRVGVFATRSPFRPNPVGLSCVKLLRLEKDPKYGPVLVVSGADLADGTPIYDIKPYLAYTDAHPEASSSFAGQYFSQHLEVFWSERIPGIMPEKQRRVLSEILAEDPRPHYQADPERVYHLRYGGWSVSFQVFGNKLTVMSAEKEQGGSADESH